VLLGLSYFPPARSADLPLISGPVALSTNAQLMNGAQNQTAGCIPNPNLNGPPFVDGCPIPAAGLNHLGIGCLNIMTQDGVHNDGTGDNTGALARAIAARGPLNQWCVYFPKGVYSFAFQQTITLTNTSSMITIVGDGSDATELTWPNANGGIAINFAASTANGTNNSIQIRDLTLSTGQQGGGTALLLKMTGTTHITGPFQPQSVVDRVTVRGTDRYAIKPSFNYWNIGVHSLGVSQISFNTFTYQGETYPETNPGYLGRGIGIVVEARYFDEIVVVFNVTNSTFNYGLYAIELGTGAQGLTFNQSNVVGGHSGIVVPSDKIGNDQITVANSQFNVDVSGIYVQNASPDIMVRDNLFLIPYGTGVSLQKALRSSITNNHFVGVLPNIGNIGINVDNNVEGTLIGANWFDNLPTAITLAGLSSANTVYGNVYRNVSTALVDAGTNNVIDQSCSGTPTSSFASVNGIVTHC
jgi:hypothetical protein